MGPGVLGSERDPRAQASEGPGLGGRKSGPQAAARGWENAPPTCVLCGAGGDVSRGRARVAPGKGSLREGLWCEEHCPQPSQNRILEEESERLKKNRRALPIHRFLTTDVSGRTVFCGRAVLCVVGCFSASQACAHSMPMAPRPCSV